MTSFLPVLKNMIPNFDMQHMKLPDMATFHKVGCDIYSQNFYKHWDEGGLEQYLDKVFGVETLKIELSGKSIQYYVAFIGREPVAFMKINLFSNLPGLDMKKV